MKKTLSICLGIIFALALTLVFLPTTLETPVAAATSGYYTYTVSNGKAIITDVNTSISGDVTIPSTTWGYPVTSISSSAFKDCTGLTSITIPDSVTYIGELAFKNCSSLTSITIPDSVTYIGIGAFSDTAYYSNASNWTENVLYIGNHLIDAKDSFSGPYTIKDGTKTIAEWAFSYCDSLTSVTIPNEIKAIEKYTFFYCSSLESVDLPNSVKYIAQDAFHGCTSLASIEIPDSVTSIGDSGFSGCSSLASITIGKGVTSIGLCAISGCSSLASITVSVDNPVYHSAGNCIIDTANKVLTHGCNTSIIPNDGSVTSIGTYAFANCDPLPHIVIPDSVTYIGVYAFYYCDSLTSISIPDSVTSIGECAFYNCTSLTSITIPDSVTYIGGSAFFETAYHSNASNWTENVLYIGNHLIDAKDSFSGPYTIKDGTKTIAGHAFYYCDSLTSISIPDSVTSIGDYAFYGCSNLTDVWYNGTASDRQLITIESRNERLTSATWHYVDGNCDGDCNVCGKTRNASHVYDSTCDTECNECGFVRSVPHDYTSYDKSATEHWMKCSVCGTIDESTREEHKYDNACDTDCNVCGQVRAITHTYSNACDTTCNLCGAEREVPDHVYDNDKDPGCNECGFVRFTPGDLDGVPGVSMDDAIYLLFNINFPGSYPVNQPLDFDGNGEENMDDAIYLLFHVNFPDSYPLH